METAGGWRPLVGIESHQTPHVAALVGVWLDVQAEALALSVCVVAVARVLAACVVIGAGQGDTVPGKVSTKSVACDRKSVDRHK